MDLSITGHHFTLSDRVKRYVEGEATKLERFYSPILNCKVTITEKHRAHRVVVATHVNGQNLSSSEEAEGV